MGKYIQWLWFAGEGYSLIQYFTNRFSGNINFYSKMKVQ